MMSVKHSVMRPLPEAQNITGKRTSNGVNSTVGRIETGGSILCSSAPGSHAAIACITTEYGQALYVHTQRLRNEMATTYTRLI